MPCEIKIYSLKDFLRLNEVGSLDRERSKAMIRKLSTASVIHETDNILIDLRETTLVDCSMADLLEIASEFVRYLHPFTGKIANMIPADRDRLDVARRFKSSLVLHGFDYDFFTSFEDAIEWLSSPSKVESCEP